MGDSEGSVTSALSLLMSTHDGRLVALDVDRLEPGGELVTGLSTMDEDGEELGSSTPHRERVIEPDRVHHLQVQVRPTDLLVRLDGEDLFWDEIPGQGARSGDSGFVGLLSAGPVRIDEWKATVFPLASRPEVAPPSASREAARGQPEQPAARSQPPPPPPPPPGHPPPPRGGRPPPRGGPPPR